MSKLARLLLFLLVAFASLAPVHAAPQAAPLAAPQAAPLEISVGNPVTTLAGPWKFTPGDSPLVNGVPAWAGPAFNDAAWSSMDLHGETGAIDAAYGRSGYVPGWTAHGFPDLYGYAWYRVRVHIVDSSQPLWLQMPQHVDDAYQVYANGKRIGEFGHFTPGHVVCYRSRTIMLPLPAPDAHGDIVLAVRFYMEPFVLAAGSTKDSGGMHQAPLAGRRPAIELLAHSEEMTQILNSITPVFVTLFLIIAAAGAFWLWRLDRPRSTYLWLAAGLALMAASDLVHVLSFSTYWLSQDVAAEVANSFYDFASLCWIQFWRRWFRLPRRRVIDGLLIAIAIVIPLSQVFEYFVSDYHLTVTLLRFEVGYKCLQGILLFSTLAAGIRKDRNGGLLAMPAILLLSISLFDQIITGTLGISVTMRPFGIGIRFNYVTEVLLVLVAGALALRKFIASQVNQRLERQAFDLELAQARELQQHVLVPEQVQSELFKVETAYHPARTVGGDFFQVLSRSDGSLLIVVGDVSGKGMAAAMLVAVLVGAIRTRAADTFAPEAILQTLNARLIGRAGGHFATCIAVHLLPDCTMQIANAGHVPPYLDGRELQTAGNLPLGILADAAYPSERFVLAAGKQMTLMTDGVAEATGTTGELFGFDRAAALSSRPAESIAQAAQSFGQDDDITVLTLSLAPAGVVHA